jgi:hypothetical protein
MKKGSGFTLVLVLIAGIAIVAIVGIGYVSPSYKQLTHEQPNQNQTDNQENSPGGYGMKKPFYQKGGVSLQHYWPGDGSFSNEETEILLLNESSSDLQVKSFDLTYAVEGKIYLQKSGNWEKFPTKQSWDKIEYLNISPQYYKNEPLILEPGQKGKLHWHMNFGSQPLDGKQAVHVKLTLLKGNEAITIDEEFHRDSGTVVSSDEH